MMPAECSLGALATMQSFFFFFFFVSPLIFIFSNVLRFLIMGQGWWCRTKKTTSPIPKVFTNTNKNTDIHT